MRAMPRVGAPLGPAGTKRPERPRRVFVSSSVVRSRRGGVSSAVTRKQARAPESGEELVGDETQAGPSLGVGSRHPPGEVPEFRDGTVVLDHLFDGGPGPSV